MKHGKVTILTISEAYLCKNTKVHELIEHGEFMIHKIHGVIVPNRRSLLVALESGMALDKHWPKVGEGDHEH